MSDKNLVSYYETSNGKVINYETDIGNPTTNPDWSDSLKITSQCTDFTFLGKAIYGGQEDCVDMNNRCNNVRVVAEFHPQGKYVATIKGGCTNIFLEGTIYGKGKEVDVDIGNWSDQSTNPTTGVVLDVKKADGSPVYVRVLNGAAPTLKGGNYKFIFPKPNTWYHDIVVKIFMLFNRIIKK